MSPPKSTEPNEPSSIILKSSTYGSSVASKEAIVSEKDSARKAKEFWIRDVTLSHISDFAYTFDRSGRFLYANQPLLSLWGLTLADAVGKNFYDLNYPADLAAKLQQQIQEVFDAGKIVADETPYTNQAGHHSYYEYIFTPIFAADGTVEAVAGSTRDISRRKRVEKNLAFLSALSRDLPSLTRVDDMMQNIGAKIAEYLDLSLCTFVEINESEDQAIVNYDWHRKDVPSLVGSYRLAEYLTDDYQKAGRAGETFVVRDTKIDVRTDPKRFAELCIGSFVCVPLVRDGQWRFLLCIHHSEAYDWLQDEIDLIREVTSRVWQRLEAVRAENALNQSIEALDKQRRLYDAVLSNTPDLVYVFDFNHRFTYANEALLKMWGRKWDDAIGKNCLELGYEPWHAEMHSREIEQVIATKKPIRGEVPFTGTHGRRIYDYIFVPVLDSKGQVEAVCGTTRDVTDRKRTEAAETAEKRVFELMATGASLKETLNALAHQMEALSIDKIISSILLLDESGQKLEHGAAPNLPAAYNEVIHGIRIGPKAGSCGTAAFERKPVFVSDIASDPRWVDFKELAQTHGLGACCSMPVFSSEKKLLGTVAMYYPTLHALSESDRRLIEHASRLAAIVIESKQLEKAARENEEQLRAVLSDQNKKLEELVQQRTARLQETILELEAFSYSISHDMRSPLRAMQGYADALLKDHAPALEAEAANYLQRIERGARRLELLVRDVLAYSKVAKGDLQLKRISVEKLILDILQNYGHLDASKIRVHLKPMPEVIGHEGLLTQVISNLLANALKFSKAGVFPEMSISAVTVENRVVISFSDNGIGVAAEDFNEIFKIFGRVYPEKQYEGTGIGLAIVKKACERMGGMVGVESELGMGSRFWISLLKAT